MTRSHFIVVSSILLLAACQSDTITSTVVPKEHVTAMPHQSHAAPMTMPPADTGSSDMAPSANRGISWTLPKGWSEQPPADMRVGSFLAKGANGQTVDISIVPLSGPAGGLLANVNRWRGQIQLAPISENELSSAVKKVTMGKKSVNWIDVVSTEPLIDNKFKKRLVTALYEHNDRTWFFKMTGESSAVNDIKPSFRDFIAAVKIND